MIIKPKPNASQRTKNRLREHNPFYFISTPRKVFTMDNRTCVLCRSEKWFGWLPIEEIEYGDLK